MVYSRNQYKKIYFGEAVIRGPIIWRADYFKRLGGFDDVSYYLGRDDCDLSFRGQRSGFSVGYTPINAHSIASEGTSRKPRSIKTLVNLKKREILAEKFRGELRCYWDENI
jgi:GT2 family glycosyltransferase